MFSTIVCVIVAEIFNQQKQPRRKSMKKFVSTFVLLIALSCAVSADDGTTHSGGKTCPEGQTCLVVSPDAGKSEKTFYTGILYFLKALLG
jgi:hypothetical protein